VRNGQPNHLASIVTSHNNSVIGYVAIRSDIMCIWLGEVNGKRISLGIVMAPEAVLWHHFKGGNQGEIRTNINVSSG
jgi:hypothetical protein